MEKKEVVLSTQKVKKEKLVKRTFFIALSIIFILLLILYFVIGIIYNRSNFSITLDQNLYFDKGLIIYDDPTYKVYRTELFAESPEQFDNVSYSWLPNDLDELGGGSHNGRNYFAYTFYIENTGESVSDYWSEIVIEDVIRNVDDAVRIRIYRNGVEETYAKLSASGVPEPRTTPFVDRNLVARNHVENFGPGQVDRYTLVLWIEGSDLECTDNILGGEFKVYMDFKSEHIEEEKEGERS